MATTSTATPASSDRVEEQVLLDAPRERVWRALTTAGELGAWFGANLSGATIAPGAHVQGRVTIPGYEHVPFDVIIEEVVPQRRFSWRWHPGTGDMKEEEYSSEPRTLVTFTLEDAAGGRTLLRLVESGFEALPASRRVPASKRNGQGWAGQLQKRLPAYLASA